MAEKLTQNESRAVASKSAMVRRAADRKAEWIDQQLEKHDARLTPEAKKLFVSLCSKALAFGENAKKCGVSRVAVHAELKRDPQFRRDVDEAILSQAETLEDAAFQRAIRKSDLLAIFLLKGMMPDKYGDRVRVESLSTVDIVVDLRRDAVDAVDVDAELVADTVEPDS